MPLSIQEEIECYQLTELERKEFERKSGASIHSSDPDDVRSNDSPERVVLHTSDELQQQIHNQDGTDGSDRPLVLVKYWICGTPQARRKCRSFLEQHVSVSYLHL